MAPVNLPARTSSLAVALVLIEGTRHYAWAWFPVEQRGDVSKALGAAATLCLLGIIWSMAKQSRLLLCAMVWAAWEEGQVLTCSIAHAVNPWPIPVGESICSAWVGRDIGALGIVFVAILALYLTFTNADDPKLWSRGGE